MSLYEKVNKIQTELNAPKSQYNNFGKYSYRNCEDILQAIKPLLKSTGLLLIIEDDVVMIGDRFYIKATAKLTDGESAISNTAFARESLTKKGMDDAQVTGSTSSYARKYALNGLLCIDDNKDSDTVNNFEYLLNEGSAIEFYGFVSNLDDATRDNLFNSAPKGEKQKLKDAWRAKQNEGIKEINRLIADIQSGDDEIKEEAINSMSDAEKQIVRAMMQAKKQA